MEEIGHQAADNIGGCDSRYRRHSCLWSRSPDRIAQAMVDQLRLPGAIVLDAGCGEGRNAFHLAECGAEVHAVDVSAPALENGRLAWPEVNGVHWHRGDVRTLPLPPASFDGVLACSLLHWLDTMADIAQVIACFKEATRPGGINALLVFNARHPYRRPAGEDRSPTLLAHSWYLGRYADWIVVEESDRDSTHTHAGNAEPHTHGVTRIIARRPDSSKTP